MKTKHYIIVLLFLCFGSAKAQAQTFELYLNGNDTINKIDIKNHKVGKWVIMGKHKPGSGYSSERIIETGNYINNRKEGLWIEYYKNGKMRNKLTYVNGTLNGPATFYDAQEKVLKEGTFKDNKWVQ
jgi:antitoxin component YwqK of YwqJK toxin-antitoxin module